MSGINCHMIFGQATSTSQDAHSPDLWKIPSWGSGPQSPSPMRISSGPSLLSSGSLARQASSPIGLQRARSGMPRLKTLSSMKSLRSGSELGRLTRAKTGSGALPRVQFGASRLTGGAGVEWGGRQGGNGVIRERRRWWGVPRISRLLTNFVGSVANGAVKFACRLNVASLAYLHDHRSALLIASAHQKTGNPACLVIHLAKDVCSVTCSYIGTDACHKILGSDVQSAPRIL